MSIVPARDDISSAKTDEWSEPPPGLTAEDRYEATVSTLPERNDISPDKANERSPKRFFQAPRPFIRELQSNYGNQGI